MSGEHELLGYVYLTAVVAFFGVALPGYAWARKVWPETGWNRIGNVSTSVIQPMDLVIAGGYLMFFALAWKEVPEAVPKAEEVMSPVGKVIVGTLGFVFLAAVIPAVLYWRVDLREFFGLRWEGWKKVFWMAPAFVFAMMVFGSLLLAFGWPDWVQETFGTKGQESVRMLKESKDVGLLLVLAISAVVVAPVVEEVIFRGYLYPVVKRYSDRWFAALFTGVVFGVIHMNIFGLPTLAVIGVVLVVLYEVTGSLWVTIACHAAFNATTVGFVFLSRWLPDQLH